ncbi:hypothetical protein EYZ11_003985 [Aspergillus tanneri]|uniref:Nucleolar 27S pre-rRNA processing Urb2/Npa2 C-terminal domain-containing protein n=1 Tax=Aspergillus tanneri TaxID=1220188 RepID=A0A4S3JSK6_9EURO|nr:hypothetical protein EYZ11_003985 [Aspergillus tanneri]
MPSVAERPRSSQEALLRLEKGSGSPTAQLNEAAQIIGLDLALCASHPQINRNPYIQTRAVPKEEWVLRWLLKKLKAGINYRIEPASFLLLRQLIDLIPAKALAITLKDQKFLGILSHAITDLEEEVFTGLENGTTELLYSDSESSTTLSDSPHDVGKYDKKGTKRKRPGDSEQDAMDIDDQPRNPSSCFLTFIRALDCLYSLAMLASRTLGIEEAASAHLRHALKGEPETIALMLGKSLRIAAVATTQFSRARKTTDLQHLLYVLPAVLELWELRSYRRSDSDSGSDNEFFAKLCFQSALRLHLCVRSVRLDTDERAEVLQGVERLIALHVVLPARAAFFDRGGSGIDYSATETDWSPVKPVSDTFKPILCGTEFPPAATGKNTHEAPWLETLFVAVAEIAYWVVKAENADIYLPEFVGVLERLFRADIFLPNSGLPDSTKLLKALLEKIFLQWRSGVSRTHISYDVIKSGIVIPLLRGFVTARDLRTFMKLWHEQLIRVEEARLQDSTLSLFTVWEDDDVCNVYSELMRSPLTHAYAAVQMHTAASEVRGKDSKVSATPGAYAQVLILEAGLRSRPLTSTIPHEDLEPILDVLTSTLSSKQSLHWRWRLWRLARNLLENNGPSTRDGRVAADVGLMDSAAKSIQRHSTDEMQKPCATLECFEAYRFSLASVKASASSSNVDKFNSLMKNIAGFLRVSSKQDILQWMDSPWDGRAETLSSPITLALAYSLALIGSPDAWSLIESDTRRSLFQHMLSMATSQYRPSSSVLETAPAGARFLQAWASVVCHEYLLNTPIIVTDLIQVLTGAAKEDTSNRMLYIESLQRIPAPLIIRGQRAILLELMQEIILQKNSTPDVTVGVLSLMAKLADMPKSAATITSDWEPMWTVAKAVSLNGNDVDLQIMKAFRNLHRAVVAKLLVQSDEDRRKTFKKMYRKVLAKASKLRSVDRDSMDCFFLRISLSQLWIHRRSFPAVFNETELITCRQKVFELVVAEVKAARDQCKKQKLEETITLIKILDALEDFEDLATNHAEVEKFLVKIESYVEKSLDSDSSLRRLIRRRILAGRGSDKSVTVPIIQYAEALPLQQLYSEEQRLFIRSTSARFRELTMDERIQVIRDVRELGFLGDSAQQHLLISGLAVASLTPIEDKDSDSAKELSLLCTVVTDSVSRSKSIEQFTFGMECLDLILRNHTRCVTQWNVDSLLACVAVCASKAGPRINPEYSGTVYIRLCRIMGILLGIHRQKLGGRFHLILPAMQRLLNCLFARTRKRTRSMLSEKRSTEQPFWLAPLQAAHAVHFTRLLTSLCDPTVSAVSRPAQGGTATEGLTDQTKKAKRLAGQYLQYLIMEYAQSSLRGTLAPEVKAAIMPGLYSALDVMSRDTMRALNAGLDGSGRAVFKGLYDDYLKFGKWNQG